MKLARQMQMFFIQLDNECVHEDKATLARTNGKEGRYRISVRTMDLNDELGQISHILTDKTGMRTGLCRTQPWIS